MTDKESFVRNCPKFQYKYSPKNRVSDDRYVFSDYVAVSNVGGKALDKAYAYAVGLFETELARKAKEELSYQHGIPAIKQIESISVVFGPDVYDRNYRLTMEDDPDYFEEPQRVFDYHIVWDNDFTEILSAEEYNQVI